VSLQNLVRACRSAVLVAGVAATATVGALVIDLRNYQPFLYLLGSFFVPLFAVLLADWLLAGRHYEPSTSSAFPKYGSRWWWPGWPASACTSGSIRRAQAGGPTWSRTPIPTRLPWGGRLDSELCAAFALAAAARLLARRPYSRERVIALIGNLSRDLLPGRSPRQEAAPSTAPALCSAFACRHA